MKEIEVEQTKACIGYALQYLDEGDTQLATFVLRDAPVVKSVEELSDLAWSMYKGFPSRNDVLYLVELINKEMEEWKRE
ncbi:MAG: hypothetical protein ACTSPB_21155 [Candidatus Thorarchaeota archaeon]